MEAKGHTGQVSFDGTFLTISRRGFLARTSVGKGEKRIPVTQLTAVQFKPAGTLVNGFIQFSLGGGQERRSQFGRQTTDASRDENSVVFTKSQQPAFEQLRAAVETALAGTPVNSPVRGDADIAMQLGRLADLRDRAVLSDIEFSEAKRKILDG